MERTFTEAELRQRLHDRAPEIEEALIGRLRDDELFKYHSLRLEGTLNADGSISLSEIEPLRRVVREGTLLILREFMACLLTTLFEEERA